MDLLLHPTTWHQFNALKQSKPQAVLISGKSGSGKHTLALELTKNVLAITDLENQPYVLQITPDKHVSIEDVRAVRQFLKKKTTGSSDLRRVVVITDAHTMTSDAQNALLKTLEEPPADTLIILTANDVTALKPTIRSRSTLLTVLPVDLESSLTFFGKQNFTPEQIKTAYFLSAGEAGLMSALLADHQEHPLVRAIADAKKLLTVAKYERLLRVDELSKQKDQLELLLQGLQRVITGGLRQAAASDNAKQTKRFYDLSQAVMKADAQYKQNVNAKLLLTNLFLAM